MVVKFEARFYCQRRKEKDPHASQKMTQAPEIHTPVSHPPEDQPAELAEHQLSYVLASGKFGREYSPHENGEASGPKGPWPGRCR